MHVASLQRFMRSLVEPLKDAGAGAKFVAEIEAACEALAPFQDLSIGDFAAFLKRAEEFDRTGQVAVIAKPGRQPKAKAAPPNVDDVVREVRELYERATSEEVTYSLIDGEVKKLDKLTKPVVDEVTKALGLGKGKTKAASLTLIRDMISEYKKSHQRTQF